LIKTYTGWREFLQLIEMMLPRQHRSGRVDPQGTGCFLRERKKTAGPKCHAFFCIAASTRLGVKGHSLKRTPTASKIALAIAPAGLVYAPAKLVNSRPADATAASHEYDLIIR
jgi:hypothetical protein